jgi:hypothetical protein
MKWTSPKVGDTRVRRKFAWLPERCSKSARRWWLCRVWVREVYSSPPAALTEYAGLWWATEAIGDAREDVELTPEPVPEPKPCPDCASNLGKRLQAQRSAADARREVAKGEAERRQAIDRAGKLARDVGTLGMQVQALTAENQRVKAASGEQVRLLNEHVRNMQIEMNRLRQSEQAAQRADPHEIQELKAKNHDLAMQVQFLERNHVGPLPKPPATAKKPRKAKEGGGA